MKKIVSLIVTLLTIATLANTYTTTTYAASTPEVKLNSNGTITVENSTLDESILLKSDGFPTYNFANVIDDHMMEITHVVRGNEYLSSSPKYNRLYEAFGWEVPTYVHCPLITDETHKKLSKRCGHSSYEDLIEQGFVKDAVVNYVALLGWCPTDNQEIFSLEELIKAFDYHHMSKSPAVFDYTKLKWMNGCYIRALIVEDFHKLASVEYDAVGYAIPTTTMKRIVDELISNGKVVSRAKLGITYAAIDSITAEMNGYDYKGILIDSVSEDSGLYGKAEKGDVITHINGIEITNDNIVLDIIENSRAGDKITVTIATNSGTVKTVEAKLSANIGESSYKAIEEKPEINKDGAFNFPEGE